MLGGGEQYVENVCMYAARSHLYSGIITQTAQCRAPQGKHSPWQRRPLRHTEHDYVADTWHTRHCTG